MIFDASRPLSSSVSSFYLSNLNVVHTQSREYVFVFGHLMQFDQEFDFCYILKVMIEERLFDVNSLLLAINGIKYSA